ncbi:TonB-dependent receptor plug domain-containing protein [Arcobacter sp. FWKO B]|uniref:TonB-dependent receptor plug domain-containing protein n=1 Tax=Arcobacter sp. FWKO B TaxID=2593672 RepID=UPI0018A36BC7|nr:TonB-dependent receptor [Arcobacter sp. FWKO B]QOG12776.1 TonB-dependent receptor [Arcobacter sp. FWKO B]
MAGVINIITKKIPNEPTTTASISRGSYKVKSSTGTTAANEVVTPTRQSTAFNASYADGIGENTSFMAMYEHKEDEGHNKLPQKAVSDTVLLKTTTHVNDNLKVTANIGAERQRVDATTVPTTTLSKYEREYDSIFTSLGAVHSTKSHLWTTNVNYKDQDVSTSTGRSSGNYQQTMVESIYTHLGDSQWITVGGEARNEEADITNLAANYTDVEYQVKVDIKNYAAFVQDEISFFDGDLVVIPGVRFEDHSKYGNSTSPKISTMYKIGDNTTFRVSVGKAFKAPHLQQLYMDRTRKHGSFEYEKSNPNLKAEKSLGYNLSLEHKWQDVPLWGSLSAFQTDVKDMVIKVDTGNLILGLPERTYDNADKAEVKGLEMAFQWGEDRGFYLNGSAGITSSKQTSGIYKDKYITYVPKHQINITPGYTANSGKYGVQLNYLITGKQYQDVNNTLETKAHNVLDMNTWMLIGSKKDAPKLSLTLANLTDSDKGETQVNRYRVGRSVKVALSGKF